MRRSMSAEGAAAVACADSSLPLRDIDAGAVDSFAVGSMVEVPAGGRAKVLVVRATPDKFYAVGTKCTHAGAPLVKGVTSGDRILCPWHSACFNLATGDIEDGPVLDAIPHYPCRVDGDRVVVSVPEQMPRSHKRPMAMCRARALDERHFVVLGGGAAGATAVETLRQEGYTGRITLVSAEKHLPYDRVKLSKNMAMTAADVELRSEAFYSDHGVQVLLGHAATRVDPATKTVELDSGSTLRYDRLLLATGGRCRAFREGERGAVPGAALRNVFTLRTLEDAQAINAVVAEHSNVVVVGSGFIGMEAAAYFVQVGARWPRRPAAHRRSP